MGRLRRFLGRLGNPHLGYPIVHVGGTSGKGSTSTTIAAILPAAGYRTGLHTSPYLQTPLEKLQIDGQLIDARSLCPASSTGCWRRTTPGWHPARSRSPTERRGWP